jgi:hypothetical protein
MGKENPTEGGDGLPIRDHPSIQKFFKSRADLIAKEKEQRSGMYSPIVVVIIIYFSKPNTLYCGFSNLQYGSQCLDHLEH